MLYPISCSLASIRRPSAIPGLLLIGLCLVAASAPAEPVAERLAVILAGPDHEFSAPHAQREWPHLQAFYEARDYQPIWVDTSAPLPRARDFVDALAQAERDGLEPHQYGPAALAAMLDDSTPSGLATLELLFSAELLHYAGDLQRGRLNPARVDPQLYTYPDDFDRMAVLTGVAASDDIGAFLRDLAPGSRPYRRLREALAHYRDLAAAGGWPLLPEGPTLKPGMQDARVAVLRQRLAASGDLTPANGESTLYDAELERGVIRYQQRYGLDADGAVGPRTRAAMNVPVADRIDQIKLNMERWRWMPDDLGHRHIHVNLAGFEVDLIEAGQSILAMRAIVGRTYRQTPVFSDRMSYLEINPTWTVPPGITRNDILPRLREDPGYLAANNFDVYVGWSNAAPAIDPYAVDWHAVDPQRIPYRFVQRPGPQNALGRIKFMFPNRYNVYLHDTPSPELFQKTVRAFSSGCIRIERPVDLAQAILADQPDWTRERIQSTIDAGGTRIVRLATPLPVHLIYATSWVDSDGVIHFRDDIYNRDARLRAAL